MKKKLTILLVLLFAFISTLLCACESGSNSNTGDNIRFTTLTVEDDIVTSKTAIPNLQDQFSFTHEIKKNGKATFKVSLDEFCLEDYPTGIVPLQEGENVFYVFEFVNGEYTKMYTVNLYRNHLYKLTYELPDSQTLEVYVEEGDLAKPLSVEVDGYEFVSWNFDFTKPITNSQTITGVWNQESVFYTVNYYFETLVENQYDIGKTEKIVAFTGDTAYVNTRYLPTYDHFTFVSHISITIGEVKGDNSLVLKIYYQRHTYTIDTSSNTGATVQGGGAYPYQKEITLTTSYVDAQREFLGWYINGEQVGTETTLKYTVEGKASIVAVWEYGLVISTGTRIEDWEYEESLGLTSVSIYDGIEEIGWCAFYNCDTLIEFTFPEKVKVVSFQILYDCDSLKEVVLPSGIIVISAGAFYGCDNLSTIRFNGTIKEWNDIPKGDDWCKGVSATHVICKNGSVAIEQGGN